MTVDEGDRPLAPVWSWDFEVRWARDPERPVNYQVLATDEEGAERELLRRYLHDGNPPWQSYRLTHRAHHDGEHWRRQTPRGRVVRERSA